MPAQQFTTCLPTPIGELTLVATDRGLRAVLWEVDRPGRVRTSAGLIDRPNHPVLAAAAAQLAEYFAGDRAEFDLPLDLDGTDFQRKAWLALATIPYGHTATYGEQAARIGRPGASRAVGAANGRNPLSIVLPCHRVIGADGSLTGFAAGLDIKRRLLAHEQSHRNRFVRGSAAESASRQGTPTPPPQPPRL